MPTGRITKRAVDELKGGSKELFLWDADLKGFGLRVTSRGAKSYVLQYRMGGREAPSRRYTIGGQGSPWTPEKARREAERLLMLVRQGIDPVQADKERRRQAVDLAFDAYVDAFTTLYLKRRWKQWQLGAGVLKREAVPILRQRPLPKIKRSDLAPIFDRLQDRPAVARLTHATLRKLFRWAVSRGDLDRSPLEGVEAPPPVVARDRVLSDIELACVWNGSNALGPTFRSFFRLLILTAQRREEVAGVDWAELDRTGALWTLPAHRTKNLKPQLVPLSRAAIDLLDEVAGGVQWPSRGLVFSTTGRTPISGFSKAKRKLDLILEEHLQSRGPLAGWRIHDIRRTVATGLQRLGVRFEVTESVLNHLSGAKSGVAGVYQRHDWAKEKKEALEAWADHLAAVTQESAWPRAA